MVNLEQQEQLKLAGAVAEADIESVWVDAYHKSNPFVFLYCAVLTFEEICTVSHGLCMLAAVLHAVKLVHGLQPCLHANGGKCV